MVRVKKRSASRRCVAVAAARFVSLHKLAMSHVLLGLHRLDDPGNCAVRVQVDKHCMQCRGCWTLTCVDCSKDFHGEEFRAHTSCMSEAEKYQGKLYMENRKVCVVLVDQTPLFSLTTGICHRWSGQEDRTRCVG